LTISTGRILPLLFATAFPLILSFERRYTMARMAGNRLTDQPFCRFLLEQITL
jgi:hypothetical protein